MDRRTFVKSAGMLMALSGYAIPKTDKDMKHLNKKIQVVKSDANFRREALASPLGFKGGYLTELWQTAVRLQSQSGESGMGMATQSVLYGDEKVFSEHSEAGGNSLMFSLTDFALQIVSQTPFSNPVELLEKILPRVTEEGRRLTCREDLQQNFVYNSLVSVDNAAWLLYARENKLFNFDQMIPKPYQKALSHKSDKVAIMFSVSYGMDLKEVQEAAEQGYFIFKIKTGAPGSQSEMLQKDIDRLTQIHEILKDIKTDQTSSGKVLYTMDANARYEKKESLIRYLEHSKKIGAFEHILLYEEPLNVDNSENVADVGVPVAADESVYDEESAIRRINQGYGAFVLKGIAKTLSLSMKLAHLAYERGIPCLCADLTVNPVLLDWHKNLAGRVLPFEELGMGMMETNGASNYKHWNRMQTENPSYGKSWTTVKNGVFELNDEFYRTSGGIFDTTQSYVNLFQERMTN